MLYAVDRRPFVQALQAWSRHDSSRLLARVSIVLVGLLLPAWSGLSAQTSSSPPPPVPEATLLSLSETSEQGLWEVTVHDTDGIYLRSQGLIKEIWRQALPQPIPEMLEAMPRIGEYAQSLIVAERQTDASGAEFVLGIVGRKGAVPELGATAFPFGVTTVVDNRSLALELARLFVDSWDGNPEMTSELQQEEGLPVPMCGCEDGCQADYDYDISLCNASYVSCQANCLAILTACSIVCAGNPACEAVCVVAFGACYLNCTSERQICFRTAERDRRRCVIDCLP